MYLKIIFLIFASISPSLSLSSGLRLLFPLEHEEYIYNLKTNVSTGTWNPSKSATYWRIEGKLKIQVYDNFTRARLSLDDLQKTVCCSNQESLNDSETADDKFLKMPWELEYQDSGYIKSMYVGDEPAWSVNFKRALSINFQLTKDYGTYTVNEPCLDDVCAVIYLCKDNLITKYTSYRKPKAENRYSWSSVPWVDHYFGRIVIDSVSSAERVYDVDDYKGLTSLELRASYQYKTHDHILAVKTDLSITYDQERPTSIINKIDVTQTTIHYVASDFSDPSNGIQTFTQDSLKNNTYRLLLQIARKGIDADNIARNASLIHSLNFIDLLNTISQLNYTTLISVFTDLVLGTSYELETARNIFLEVLPHARSEGCVRFIKYLVMEEKEQIEDAALLSLIRKLPFNVAAPHQHLLEELEVFSKLGPDFSPDIRHAGILSFATLLHKTMTLSQVKQDYFDKVVVKYFRMYSDCPQYLDRMIWLQGLCNIGFSAESYAKIIHTDNSRDRHERVWAALAVNPKMENPYVILETSLPIITNESESIQLRIIALHTFLSSTNIRESDFMFVHNYIRNCENAQLKRFWFATIRNLEANKNFEEYRVTSFYIPFIVNQISTPDPQYWTTDNFILSVQEDYRSPSVQILSIGDPEGIYPVFVGAKLNTGGKRPYKVDVYLVMEGIATGVFNKFNRFNSKDLKVDDLIQLLKKLGAWAVKTPEKVHIDLVIKVHDKTVFATHMNQSRFETWNGEDLAYINDFLRFGSHINQQIVYYPYQSDINIPSELGTPIRLQSTILSFTSIRGNLTAPSSEDLTWKNDLHVRYQGTSLTSLTTYGPLLGSLHSARIQQSLVAHLPMRFNVFVSAADQALELTWPNPGAQQGGVAMHARAQIAVETANLSATSTVPAGNRDLATFDNRSVFFDCERPLTGGEVLDKIFASKTVHYDLLTSIQPSLIILNSILLFSSPPSGSCGLILPPQHLMKTPNDVLKLKIQVDQMSLNKDLMRSTKFNLLVSLDYLSREDPNKVFFELRVLALLQNVGANDILQFTIHGLQPSLDNSTRKEWMIRLREQDIRPTSDQDSFEPYKGELSLTYSGNNSHMDTGSELTLKYRGIRQNFYGKLERNFDVHVDGSNLSEMGILESELVTQTALGQLVRSYTKAPLNMTAVIKERDGLASVTVNEGRQIQFKADNIAWLLNSWTDMQMKKNYGFYRECRLHGNTVDMLFGDSEPFHTTTCAETLIVADCTQIQPRFAVIRLQDGVKVYAGEFSVSVKLAADQKPTVDRDNGGNQFWFSYFDKTVKLVSRTTDLQVFVNDKELVVLVPHGYLNSVCGLCTDRQKYNYC